MIRTARGQFLPTRLQPNATPGPQPAWRFSIRQHHRAEHPLPGGLPPESLLPPAPPGRAPSARSALRQGAFARAPPDPAAPGCAIVHHRCAIAHRSADSVAITPGPDVAGRPLAHCCHIAPARLAQAPRIRPSPPPYRLAIAALHADNTVAKLQRHRVQLLQHRQPCVPPVATPCSPSAPCSLH